MIISDIIHILEDFGFNRKKKLDERVEGCFLLDPGPNITRELKVYLGREYIQIDLTPSFIKVEIYKNIEDELIFLSWSYVMSKRFRKSVNGMKEFKNFLLLSICRNSFLNEYEDN